MKPILFNTEMVRAILDGRKTVTRRVVKPRPYSEKSDGPLFWRWKDCQWADGGQGFPESGIKDHAPYKPGDILYVRETWAKQQGLYWHKAGLEIDEDGRAYGVVPPDYWRPSIHMPKAAARIFLRVTDVYPQHLQDMTEDDVCAEGAEQIINFCEHMDFVVDPPEPCYNVNPCKDCFINYSYPELFGRMVWDDIIKKKDLPLYSWDANPWVWVIEFERLERDAVGC